MSTDVPGTGIVVYRASRLEALLEPLETLLAAFPPNALLAPQTVLAAHPGMRRWLGLALAERRGARGIVANLEVLLPSHWIDRRAQQRLGASAVGLAHYRRDTLRWHIHVLLPQIDNEQLAPYLAGGDERRRFQLADHLAAIYVRHMVYRPDWLLRWQRGQSTPGAGFLAPLWQQLRREIALPHRGEVLQQLLQPDPGTEADDDLPLHVFGLSHLAPLELAVLRATSRQRLVVLYLPDPCFEYWAGLGNERTRLRDLLALGEGAEDSGEGEVRREHELLQIGHPLLAAWGRLGQHFGLALSTGEGGVISDTRHHADQARSHDPPNLLHCLQQSIRELRPDRVDAALRDREQACADASLRVHGCHTRLRELEVLRDAMLDALRRDPGLHPSEMVVMAPDIGAYVQLLPAVFGASGDRHAPLPYHVADVPLQRAHALFQSFEQLLRLPESRISAPQLLDLLATPSLRRALGLDNDGVDALRRWLGEARAAWGLDAGTRTHFGLPAFAEHSLGWSMDRLLAGYVHGDPDATLDDDPHDLQRNVVGDRVAGQLGLWPVAGVHGLQVEALGAFDRLLGEIDALLRAARMPRPLSQWCDYLQSLIERLFTADHDDAGEREAVVMLGQFVAGLRQEAAAADCDPELPFALLRDLLLERIDTVPDRQRFLLGTATFCGMVPQRSIPFRFIAVLGLDDGEFPRQGGDSGLDPMAGAARLGDRDVRNDDRYLFLETLMAARGQLHLSYISEGARDGRPCNPAAPLAELLDFLDDRADWTRDDEHLLAARASHGGWRRPWRLQHALQPFDARYFDAPPGAEGAAFFSYQTAFAAMRAASDAQVPRFVPAQMPVRADATSGNVTLHDIHAYFRDPARALLGSHLHLQLRALEDDSLAEREALSSQLPKLERVPRSLVLDALASGDHDIPHEAPARLRLSGALPPAAIGALAWEQARAQAMATLAAVHDDALLTRAPLRPQPIAIDVEVAGWHIEGQLERVYRNGDHLVLLDVFPDRSMAKLGFRERIPFFIEWALLQQVATGPAPVARLLCSDGASPWVERLHRRAAEAPKSLQQALARLVEFWARAQQHPLAYFPRTSWAISQAAPEQRRAAAAQAWRSNDGTHGESTHRPGHAEWLSRGVALLAEDSAEWQALEAHALALAECIDALAEPAARASRRSRT